MKTAAILILIGFVGWLLVLCNAWRDRYDDLQADYDKAIAAHHKARRVDLIAKEQDVWVVVDSIYLYRFEGVCRENERRTF